MIIYIYLKKYIYIYILSENEKNEWGQIEKYI